MLSLFTGRPVAILPQEDIEKALSSICRISQDAKSGGIIRISDSTFNHIAGLLANLEKHRNIGGWSLRPRTYTILRHMGCTDAMQEFIDDGLKDISFPYDEKTLPAKFASDAAKCRTFLDLQDAVLTDAVELERGEDGRHVLFARSGNEHFHVMRHLGSGGFGIVDHVFSRLSFHQYARKRFRRQIRFGIENKRFLEMIEREISALKKISHHHIVKVVGSYTDANFIAILMQPIASCNLRIYLAQKPEFFSHSRLEYLRTFFGCLARALAYLHKHKIRHRDLKPENILVSVKSRSGIEQIYITDFGTAHDSSEQEISETFDRLVPFTARYMAPEVARHAPRNSASDMWSLGIVFLEMVSVLRGTSIPNMRKYLRKNGTGNEHIWSNLGGAHEWFEVLRRRSGSGADYDNEPLAWVKDLLQNDPISRPDAASLSRVIAQSALGIFQGHCCSGDDEEWVPSMTYDEWEHLDLDHEQIGNPDIPFEVDAVDPVELTRSSFKSSSIEAWLDGTDDVSNDTSATQVAPEQLPYEVEDETESTAHSEIASENGIYEIVDDDSDDDAVSVPGIPGVDMEGDEFDPSESDLKYEVIMDSSSDSTAKARSIISDASHTTAIKDDRSKAEPDALNGSTSSAGADLTRVENRFPLGMRAKETRSAGPPGSANANKPNNSITAQWKAIRGRTVPLTTSNVAALTMDAANITTIDSENSKLDDTDTGRKRKKRLSRSKREHSTFSATKYMQETWEAASSAATSELSENTSRLLQQKGSLLAWQDKDMKFLEKFCSEGKVAAVRILLESGCKPSRIRGKPRWRPIIYAVRGASQRHTKCLRLLLEHGADVDTKEPSSGRTPLHIAIAHQSFKGYTNLIAELLKHGANPNLRDKNGDSPLLQILYGGYEQLEKHRRDALACLLQPNFSTQVNVVPPGTLNMPLHLAVRRADPWACGMLLEKRAIVSSINGSGQTPLSLAVSAWTSRESAVQIDILDLLLRKGADVNECNIVTGDTPLHIAARLGREDIMEVLLSYEADTRKMNKSRTPFHIAGEKASRDGREKHARIMRMLYEPNADESILDEHGDSHCAIVTAVEQKDCIFVQELLDYGAKANHVKKVEGKRSVEASPGATGPVRQAKIVPNQAKTTTIMTPILNIAVEGDDLATANVLVKRGAFADKEDSAGTTAFRLALNRRNIPMVELLRDRAKFEKEAYRQFASSTREVPSSAWPSLDLPSSKPQDGGPRKTRSFERKRDG